MGKREAFDLVDRHPVCWSLYEYRFVPAAQGHMAAESALDLCPFDRKGWPAHTDVGRESATLVCRAAGENATLWCCPAAQAHDRSSAEGAAD